MTALLEAAGSVCLLLAGVAAVRVVAGPSRLDRMVGVQLAVTLSVAALLLLADAARWSAGADVALVVALLGAVWPLVFTRRGPGEAG